ncbi:DUF72 domain-containing protein [Skermanella pratensis]|uniref:DUF72 domain-containing protein n=1 Tax=Skermanella pratensis TaxID=2233999 RepID=UPI00130148D5|nr:DUF72 domain-containing protein [Skermanella pratensis]
MGEHQVFVGCAGWSIPSRHTSLFPAEGSHLERYARRLPAVEINSSFYRPHKPETYARWAASVPEGFRFAVKVPKQITHERRLADPADLLGRFLGEARELGDRLGPLLVQLPPSLAYRRSTAEDFLGLLRDRFEGDIACEPRHPSWFNDGPEDLLQRFHVARVAADPVAVPGGEAPGGWNGLVYRRLHGSPEIYHTDYGPERLGAVEAAVRGDSRTAPAWCIFDNTALGAAPQNACAVWSELCSESRNPR